MKKSSILARSFIASSPSREDFLWIGAISNKKVARVIEKFFLLGSKGASGLVQSFEMPKKVANFIVLIAEEKLLSQLYEICNRIKFLAHKDGVDFIELSYTGDIYEDNLREIINNIQENLGSKIIVSTHRDDSLISGFSIKLPHQVIDLSLKSKLKQFSNHLIRTQP